MNEDENRSDKTFVKKTAEMSSSVVAEVGGEELLAFHDVLYSASFDMDIIQLNIWHAVLGNRLSGVIKTK